MAIKTYWYFNKEVGQGVSLDLEEADAVPFFTTLFNDGKITQAELDNQLGKTVPAPVTPPVVSTKDKLSIVHGILGECTSMEQARRIILAVRKYPDFLLYLDDKNWDGAVTVVDEALANNDILEEDSVLVKVKILE